MLACVYMPGCLVVYILSDPSTLHCYLYCPADMFSDVGRLTCFDSCRGTLTSVKAGYLQLSKAAQILSVWLFKS